MKALGTRREAVPYTGSPPSRAPPPHSDISDPGLYACSLKALLERVQSNNSSKDCGPSCTQERNTGTGHTPCHGQSLPSLPCTRPLTGVAWFQG